jgi:Secreted repeat of unknown function
MRHMVIASAVALMAALAISPAGHAAGSAAAVKTRHGKLGTFLVDGHGRTLYLFQKDKTKRSTCSGACATDWPPLLTSGKASRPWSRAAWSPCASEPAICAPATAPPPSATANAVTATAIEGLSSLRDGGLLVGGVGRGDDGAGPLQFRSASGHADPVNPRTVATAG